MDPLLVLWLLIAWGIGQHCTVKYLVLCGNELNDRFDSKLASTSLGCPRYGLYQAVQSIEAVPGMKKRRWRQKKAAKEGCCGAWAYLQAKISYITKYQRITQ
jgi:hypothetical protein